MSLEVISAWILALAVSADPRPIWTDGSATHQGAPSADGKWISCVDPESGDLAVREAESGKLKRLTRKGTAKEFAYFSAISRDSARVAYAWFNDEGFYDLRVVPIGGGEPKVLFRSEEAGFVQPTSWSPDGQWILTLFFRKDNISQIALVPAAGGEIRVLKSLNWVYPKKMDLSPDGRWIVYDNFARDGVSQRDIFVLSADGSRESKLIEHPAEDLFPVWSPSGERIYFASDRGGSTGLWAIPVKDGRAAGEAALVRNHLGRILPMGLTSAGSLFYAIRTGATEIRVGAWDGKFASKLDVVGEGWSPAFSADGKRLAWLVRVGAENFGQEARSIVVRDVAAGRDRPLAPKLAHIESIRWARDGKSLLASGSDGKGRGGVFRVDASTGAVSPVVQSTDAPFRGYPAVDTEAGVVFARGSDLVLAPDQAIHKGTAGITLLADGAFVEGGVVKTFDGKAIGESKPWQTLTRAGTEWLAVHPDGIVLLPSNRALGSTKAAISAASVVGGHVAVAAGKPGSEIWALDGLPR